MKEVLRHPYHLDRVAVALSAAIAFFTCVTPARADGLAGVFHPAIGLPLTIGIGVLEGAILERMVDAPNPYRESIIANLISAFLGWIIVVTALLDNWLRTTGATVLFVALIFAMTLGIEFLYLWLRWRREYGAKTIRARRLGRQ